MVSIKKKKKISEEILIIAGEHSGDLLGADLMRSLPKEFQFFGIGGKEMKKQGMVSKFEMESLSVIGFTGILTKYFPLKKIAKSLVDEAKLKNIKYAILIDYPGFNLYLAEKLKEQNIKIIFYVSPQIWAWRFKRIFKIQKLVDLILLLFPFEKKIYDKYNINSRFVGHPLSDRMEEKLKIEKDFKTSKNKRKICIMPGSRKGEIRRLLIPILDSLRIIKQKTNEELELFLPNINSSEESYIFSILENYNDLKIDYYFDKTARCIQNSDVVIVASGTATLEVAYFEKPMVIIYQLSTISYLIGKAMVLTEYVGLVNILSEKEICKELIQSNCNKENISKEVLRLFTDKDYYSEMKNNLSKVKKSLGKNASKKASETILELIYESR